MQKMITDLYKEYPGLKYYLTFNNPVQLVVAAILSPQVKDEVVNRCTEAAFKKYKTAKDFKNANDLLDFFKPITYSTAKVKYIKEAMKLLDEKFKGVVPKTVKELTELPGVGEKTAHAILQTAYNVIEGVVVDTHVLRVSYRLGLTTHPKNPKIVQRELEKVISKDHWKDYPWLMKAHGRKVCKAPKPLCDQCPINKQCPKVGVN